MYIKRLSELRLKPGCIITDVGSTKASIAECASQLALKDAYFIGGHPMAGSERSGVGAPPPSYSRMHIMCLLRRMMSLRRSWTSLWSFCRIRVLTL